MSILVKNYAKARKDACSDLLQDVNNGCIDDFDTLVKHIKEVRVWWAKVEHEEVKENAA